jgi:hypothetical protein
MKLEKSKLCVNCEALYEQPAPCPYCGSEIFVWLSRALGTTVEQDLEDMDNCVGAGKEIPASQAGVNRSGSFATAFGERFLDSKGLAEFRLACGRAGREMVRVLTLGLVQACK